MTIETASAVPSKFIAFDKAKGVAIFNANNHFSLRDVEIALANLRRQDPARFPVVPAEIKEFEKALAAFSA